MSTNNLKLFAEELGKGLADAAAGKGSKEAQRASYESLSPQVFAQDEKELQEEFRSLQGNLSGKTSSKEEIVVLPPITMDWKQIRTIWRSEFAKFKKNEKATSFKGDKTGSNGEYLTSSGKYNDWTELTKATKATIGAGGSWYICPVLDYKRANKKLKRTFGEAIAKAEIKNRKYSNRRVDEIEQSYITSRITGHQGAKVPVPGKGWQVYRPEGMTEGEKSSGIQLGHGEYGKPSFLRKAEEAEKRINKAVSSGRITAEEGELLKTGIYIAKQEWKVHLEHVEKLSLRSGFKKNYTLVIVTGQRTSKNMRDADKEKEFGDGVKIWWTRAAKSEHKTRLPQSIGNLILGKLTTGNKGVRNTSRRYKPREVIQSDERSAPVKLIYKQKTRLRISKPGLGIVAAAKKAVKSDKKQDVKPQVQPASIGDAGSPLHLRSVFNAKMAEAIKDNMGGTTLHNRTGRFAESVHVHNIAPHRGTDGIVQYSYMYNPYRIFEGDGTRDPRLIIDKTIREQAAEMAMGTFTTQRI